MKIVVFLIASFIYTIPALSLPLLQTFQTGPFDVKDQNSSTKNEVESQSSVNVTLKVPVPVLDNLKLLPGLKLERNFIKFKDESLSSFRTRELLASALAVLWTPKKGDLIYGAIERFDTPKHDAREKVFQGQFVYKLGVSPLKSFFSAATDFYVYLQLTQFPEKLEFRSVVFQKFQWTNSHLIVSIPNQLRYVHYVSPDRFHYVASIDADSEYGSFETPDNYGWTEASYSIAVWTGAQFYFHPKFYLELGVGAYYEKIKFIGSEGETVLYYDTTPAPVVMAGINAAL